MPISHIFNKSSLDFGPICTSVSWASNPKWKYPRYTKCWKCISNKIEWKHDTHEDEHEICASPKGGNLACWIEAVNEKCVICDPKGPSGINNKSWGLLHGMPEVPNQGV